MDINNFVFHDTPLRKLVIDFENSIFKIEFDYFNQFDKKSKYGLIFRTINKFSLIDLYSLEGAEINSMEIINSNQVRIFLYVHDIIGASVGSDLTFQFESYFIEELLI
jgi:hypothetical protein